MSKIVNVAAAFFDACESGKGWDVCKQYCAADATFSAQAEPVADIETLSGYTDWMKGMMTVLPDGHYEIRSLAVDEERQNVCGFGVFMGTHTGEGGPVPPTGKSFKADYVYIMDFNSEQKIRHMTKVWNAGWSLKELGWA